SEMPPRGGRGDISGGPRSLKKKPAVHRVHRPGLPAAERRLRERVLRVFGVRPARGAENDVLARDPGCICFFQAEDGIRDWSVTGVQTCALPIWMLEGTRQRVVLRRSHQADEGQ